MSKHLLTLTLALAAAITAPAHTHSGATNAVAHPVPHTTVPFRISDPGTKLPDITWGFDLAWLSEDNVRRGTLYTGPELIGIMRLSFQTTNTEALNGTLTQAQKSTLSQRIRIAKRYAPHAGINLNSDQMEGSLEQVTPWYRSSNSATQAERWAELIALSKAYVEDNGLTVVSVSPFNEPDYTPWHQGTKADFLAICKKLREDDAYRQAFANVKLCGGNTLNNDRATEWYNYCRQYLDEGNTHQLAGSFDNFASFYERVAADGKVGVADELHNILECMVASHYGMTKGIWWGTAEHTRSQFMRATRGTRLGYAENRARWTAASVYRHTDGSVQGFGGTSERQANPTSYRFVATDHDVFYDGHGPTREYIMTLPGGTGYQNGQVNAEGLVNIQGGEDIMQPLPTEPTTSRLVNRLSGHCLAPSGNSAVSGAAMAQMKYSTNLSQQWVIEPLPVDFGGDFAYYRIANAKDQTLLPDVRDWSLSDGADIILYKGGFGVNEQWFFQYAGDGWFYIRSRQSAMCLQAQPGTDAQMKISGRKVTQGTFTGQYNQQWRLLPADVKYDDVAPAQPSTLSAQPLPAAVSLSWTPPADRDLRGYTIQRSDDGGASWYVINRYVDADTYVDNTATQPITYTYRVLAQDLSLHLSDPSPIVQAQPTGQPARILLLTGDSICDASDHANHAALYGQLTLAEGHDGQAISLDGQQFLQLPATIADSPELTVATWVNLHATATWQRIFDFGNDTDHYVFLCPRPSANNRLRLAIKDGGSEEILNATVSHRLNEWMHVAVTFATDAVTIYLNGQPAATSNTITARPAHFRPLFNYIGRSQFSDDPLLKADIDQFAVYNYALTPEQVQALYSDADAITAPHNPHPSTLNQDIFDIAGRRITSLRPDAQQHNLPRGLYIIRGRKVILQ